MHVRRLKMQLQESQMFMSVLAELRLGLKGKSRDNVTHIHQQGKPCDSLHGKDEEGDHWKVPAVWMGLDPCQYLLKGGAFISEGINGLLN